MTSNPRFAAEKTDLGAEESSQSPEQMPGIGGRGVQNELLNQIFLSSGPSCAESFRGPSLESCPLPPGPGQDSRTLKGVSVSSLTS